MEKEKYKLLHNMFEWLPINIAENATYVEKTGLDVAIHISYYDDDIRTPATLSLRTFSFTGATYFNRQAIPGPEGDPFEDSYHKDGKVFDGLGEVVNSKQANAWNKHFSWTHLRHFLLPFMDNNFCFIIIAKDWKISAPQVLCNDSTDENEAYAKLLKKYGETVALKVAIMNLKFPELLRLP